MRLRLTAILRFLILWITAVQGDSLLALGVRLPASLAAAITVKGEAAQSRQGDFFSHQSTVPNQTGPVETAITVTATEAGQSESVTRRELVLGALRQPAHDADGNLLFDGYRDYTWDAENRLLSVQTRSGLVPAGGVEYRVAYAYDYAGRRIHRLAERKVGNAWYLLNQRSYLYDGWNVVAECSDTATGARQVEQSYLWGLDISGTPQGAGGVGGLLAIEKHLGAQAGIHFVSHDGNGNVVALTNAADGTLSASYEYDPFGNLLEMSGAFAAANPYRFSGKRQDELTGFCDYGFRTYDPGMGRWLSRDPIAEDGGLNLYGFVGNDGVNDMDYLGLAGGKPQKHHWFPQFGGKGKAMFQEICGGNFDIDDFTTLMDENTHLRTVHQTFKYNDMMSDFLETMKTNPDCCDLLLFVKELMGMIFWEFNMVKGKNWISAHETEVLDGRYPNMKLHKFNTKYGVVDTNNEFNSLIDQKCGTRRKCNETPERKQIKEDFMARLQAYRDFKERETFIGPGTADSPEDSELRLKMRDDEDYRFWWYEFRQPSPNPAILYKYEIKLQNSYGSNVAPKSHHTLPFWRPLPQPPVRK